MAAAAAAAVLSPGGARRRRRRAAGRGSGARRPCPGRLPGPALAQPRTRSVPGAELGRRPGCGEGGAAPVASARRRRLAEGGDPRGRAADSRATPAPPHHGSLAPSPEPTSPSASLRELFSTPGSVLREPGLDHN